MLNLWGFWKKPEEINTDITSRVLVLWNEKYDFFLDNGSWFLYLVAGLLILCSCYYHMNDNKKREELNKRQESFQSSSERVPQSRRPGAIYREHQIFRNAVKAVHKYTGPNRRQAPKNKKYILRTTRSGLVYGTFSENDEN